MARELASLMESSNSLSARGELATAPAPGTYTIVRVEYVLNVLLVQVFGAAVEDARALEEVLLDKQESGGRAGGLG